VTGPENTVHKLVEGSRTRLRPASWGFSEPELERRYRWSQDDVLQYWSGTIPGGRTYEQFRSTLAQRDWPPDGKRISYAILTQCDELIGMVSCYNIDRRHGVGELGIYLGEKDVWGSGYGTDALISFLRHLFADLGFQSVYLHTYESNLRAQRSYVRAGFETTDRRRRYAPRLGYHNELRMSISAEAFDRMHGLREPASTS
jgi:ribosomal-protein-alanine N-acetyltransferase